MENQPTGAGCDSPDQRVVLLAVDGLEWRLVRQGVAEGRLPTLARMLEAGAWAEVPIRECVPGLGWSELDLNSPTLWTTIATGQYYFRHGVFDFRNRLESFREPPLFSSRHVQSPRIWDVLSSNGRASLVVGYYVTHPAYPIQGVMVSDLFGETAARDAAAPSERIDEFAQAVGASDYAALVAGLGRLASESSIRESNDPLSEPESRALALRVLREFTSLDEAALAALLDAPTQATRRQLTEFFLLHPVLRDERAQALFLHLVARERWSFATVYYRLVDYTAHAFWFDDQPAPAMWRGFDDVLRRAYRRLDRQLGEILAKLERGTRIILASDHGFGRGTMPGDADQDRWLWGKMGAHAEPGVLIVVGGPARGRIKSPVSLLDLAPTILDHFEIPQSEALDGGVIPGLLSEAAPRRIPPVASYPYRAPSAESGLNAAERRQIERRLAALGYIE